MPSIDEGLALMQKGDVPAAIAEFQALVAAEPMNAAAHHFLGYAAAQIGDWEAADASLSEALRLEPKNPLFLGNTAIVDVQRGWLDDARLRFSTATELEPDNPRWWDGLGYCHLSAGRFCRAEHAFSRSLELDPADEMVLANLIRAQCFQGQSDEAFRMVTPMLERPHGFVLQQASIWPALYSDRTTPEILAQIIRPIAQYLPRDRTTVLFRNNRNPDRRLRIGFVSPDFRNHAVLRFLIPLFEHLDPEEAEVTLYSTIATSDSGTDWLREHVKAFRFVTNDLRKHIETDKIDVMIDLAGHSHGGRMVDFAARLAPVQINWLGFPASTGVSAIDARFVDEITDPPGSEQWANERLIRLPNGFHAFRPEAAPAVARETDRVTLGSFNNIAKLSDTSVRMWVNCLKEMPEADLIIKASSFDDPDVRDRVMARFAFWGIAPQRITLLGHAAEPEDHLRTYNRLDVALDTYPYHGTTTTCEALWMGVPVVTMMGEQHHSRVSGSLLSQVGHPDWIADSEEQFTGIVKNLPQPRTKEQREKLRFDMLNSPLMNEPEFAQKWIDAVRGEWRRWATG